MIGLSRWLTGGVDALYLRKFGKPCNDLVPLGMTAFPLTLPPLVGDRETILPVSEFERLVEGDVFRHALLHGGGTFQIELLLCVITDEIGHELGSGFHLFTIFLQGFWRRVRTIHLFSQIDIMWLLPDKERTGIRGCLTSPGICHFHPTHALEPLTLGNLPGHRIGGVVIPF